MRIRRENWGAMVVAASLVLGVGCGLSLAVDEDPPVDAGSDTSTKPIDGEAPDMLLPDGALPDGAPNEEAIDDDASFLPSNLDAAAGAYSLDAAMVLTGVTDITVTSTTVKFAADSGTIDVPAGDIHFDAECNCMVVSVKNWSVPAGTLVNVVGEIPLVVVANGDVTIDGTVKAALVRGATTVHDGPVSAGTASGAAGGGGSTAGGVGGPGTGAANPRTDGGSPRPIGKLPWTGANGGDSLGVDSPGFVPCGRGGSGGGGLQVYARVLRVGQNGRLTAVGSGAEVGCPAAGGGGGGSGGAVVLEGRLVRVAGTVLATGGGGSGGGATTIAAAGGGSAGAIQGGAGSDGGAGGGKGGQGGDDTPPGDGGAAMRGGGGGGSAGLVVVRGLNVRTDAGTFVPRPAP